MLQHADVWGRPMSEQCRPCRKADAARRACVGTHLRVPGGLGAGPPGHAVSVTLKVRSLLQLAFDWLAQGPFD
jgi:hypothetical protein